MLRCNVQHVLVQAHQTNVCRMADTISRGGRGDLWHFKMEAYPLALQNIETQAWPKMNITCL
jgi:hypothetical protein